MARRTALKPEDKRLLERIRGQHWTVEELRWVLTHLDARAPTLIIQEIHAKLIDVGGQEHAASARHGTGPLRHGGDHGAAHC
jgi:hypothetical protein